MTKSYFKKIFLPALAVCIIFAYPLSVSASERESADLPEGNISSSSELPEQSLPEDDVKTDAAVPDTTTPESFDTVEKTEDSDEEVAPSTDADSTNSEEESSSTEAYYEATYSGNESGRWRASGDRWWFETADGSYLANGIYVIDGTNYAFDGSGWMLTGWYMQTWDDGIYDWYYFQPGGAMAYGWQAIGGTWYYLDSNDGYMYENGTFLIDGQNYRFQPGGAMLTGWYMQTWGDGTYDWYYFQPGGAMAHGWQAIGGTWYYLDPTDGYMYENSFAKIDGQSYYFSTGGAMYTGWKKYVWDDGRYNWYYYQPNGAMAHGWQAVGGTWYYLHLTDGHMYDNAFVDIDGQKYQFLPGGAMHTGWKKYDRHDGTCDWYYYQPNGAMALGWQAIGGHWYYFHPTLGGWMTYDGVWHLPDGKYYAFGPSGEMLAEQWYKHPRSNTWYYLDKDGAAHTGWLEVDGKRYYFNSSGSMVTKNPNEWDGGASFDDGVRQIDGEYYAFGLDGVMVTGWQTRRFVSAQEDGTHRITTDTFFFESDGRAHEGWLYEDGAWYYFGVQWPYMYNNVLGIDIGGQKYAFAEDGKMVTGWYEKYGGKYYFNSDGTMYTGWLTYNNDRYYFSPNGGRMYSDGTYKIDGEFMTFDADGKLISSK